MLSINDEREELRQSVRQFLANKSPVSEVRRLMGTPTGYDPGVWAQLTGQLDLAGLIVPEQYGGGGFGYGELVVVLEEMGRALTCAPYFSTVALAANSILMAGDERAKNELLPGIASGAVIATLAVAEEDGNWDIRHPRVEARRSGDGYVLNGQKMYVIDGHIADLIVVVAQIDDGIAFFAVQGDANGLDRESQPTLDATRKQARLTFRDTPARLIGNPQIAGQALQDTLDLAAIALAAEMVGGAERCLEMSVDYAKMRIQFGRPIGSFQAIKHKCADMLLQIESARSAAYYAAEAVTAASDERPALASLAKAYCSEAYYRAAADNIQIHGGIGFTWEHDAHLYFKRAASSKLLLGDSDYHRELLAQRIGI
jgi:alkylation response protein AidB-like acyl-CoA dehydrogenase